MQSIKNDSISTSIFKNELKSINEEYESHFKNLITPIFTSQIDFVEVIQQFIIIASYQNKILRILNINDWSEYMELNFLEDITCVNNSIIGSLIATSLINGDIEIWNITQKTKDYFFDKQDNDINIISLSNNNQFLIAGYESGKITIWDLNTKDIILSEKIKESKIESLDWNLNDDKILMGFNDATVGIFDLPLKTLTFFQNCIIIQLRTYFG